MLTRVTGVFVMAFVASAQEPRATANLEQIVRQLSVELQQLRCAFLTHISAEEDKKLGELGSELERLRKHARILAHEARQEAAELDRSLTDPSLKDTERKELMRAREELSRQSLEHSSEAELMRRREQQLAERFTALQQSRLQLEPFLKQCTVAPQR